MQLHCCKIKLGGANLTVGAHARAQSIIHAATWPCHPQHSTYTLWVLSLCIWRRVWTLQRAKKLPRQWGKKRKRSESHDVDGESQHLDDELMNNKENSPKRKVSASTSTLTLVAVKTGIR